MRFLLPLSLLAACARPPEAPSDLYDIGAFLYAEHPSGDEAARDAGMESLSAWLDAQGQDAGEGYEVAPLTADVVSALDDNPHTVEDLWGVAVATPSDHGMGDLLHALLEAALDTVSPGQYGAFDRTWEGDIDCFLSGACERISSTEDIEVLLPMGVEGQQHTANQYVWSGTEAGDAVLQRSWLPQPGSFSMSWIVIPDQYYLQAVLPSETGAWRLQITWMVETGGVMPTDLLMQQTADSMVDLATATEAWMDGH